MKSNSQAAPHILGVFKNGKSRVTDCRQKSGSEVRGGASATAKSQTLIWFSNSKAQNNMAVLPKVLYNVKNKIKTCIPISHPQTIILCVYIVQSISERQP
jgi:hypothetical protein